MGQIFLSNVEGYYIPYDDLIVLNKKGILYLGINNRLASELADSEYLNLKPKGTACAAYKFWDWIGFGVFCGSIYFSFTRNWWWFIWGIFAAGFIWNANKKGNAENFLDAAVNDPSFYNNVLSINGWLYKIDEKYLNEFAEYKA